MCYSTAYFPLNPLSNWPTTHLGGVKGRPFLLPNTEKKSPLGNHGNNWKKGGGKKELVLLDGLDDLPTAFLVESSDAAVAFYYSLQTFLKHLKALCSLNT